MTVPYFSSTTDPGSSEAEVFLRYLEYFRSQLAVRLTGMPEVALRTSRLPSGWTPIELLQHLIYVERRWLEWGFEGREIGDPWADERDERRSGEKRADGDRHWYVPDEITLDELLEALDAQAGRTAAIVGAHDLSDVGQPGERWGGNDPATLERVLFHVLQEYARHTGHLDVVSELAGGPVGE
jgi:uncharacterized damage-inducible protein DinB